MTHSRQFRIPAYPNTVCVPETLPGPVADPYEVRLDAVAHRGSSRSGRLLAGVLTLGLGVAGGFCAHALVFPPLSVASYLTPQQQAIYDFVQDFIQESSPHERGKIQTRLENLRTTHPQPRPQPEALLPGLTRGEKQP